MRNHNSLKEPIAFPPHVVKIFLIDANHTLMYIINISPNFRDTLFSMPGAFLDTVESLLPAAESIWS